MHRKRVWYLKRAAAAKIYGITAGIIVSHGGNSAIRKRSRIKGVFTVAQQALPAVTQVVAHCAGIDALIPKNTAAVLTPIQRAVAQNRCRTHPTGIKQLFLPCRTGIDLYDPAGPVEIAFERQNCSIVERYRRGIDRIAGGRGRNQRSAVRTGRQRIPKCLQVAEGMPQHLSRAGFVILAQRPMRRKDRIRVFRTVPRHAVPDIVAVTLAGPCGHLITQLIVIGNVILVRPAEPFIGHISFGAFGHIGAVSDRKRWLQRAPERSHLRLGLYGVAFEQPHRNQRLADQARLLADEPAQRFHKGAVQIAVLDGMARLVRHQLLEPRLGIGSQVRDQFELHPLGRPHHDAVRIEILGMQYRRDLQRFVAEPVGHRRRNTLHHRKHLRSAPAEIIGINDLASRPFDLHPANTGRRPAPVIVLPPGRKRRAACPQATQTQEKSAHHAQLPAFLTRYPSRSRISTTRSRKSP